MTNTEKFKETFGFAPEVEKDGSISCIGSPKVCDEQYKKNSPLSGCSDCPFKDWWNKEYKACFRIDERWET